MRPSDKPRSRNQKRPAKRGKSILHEQTEETEQTEEDKARRKKPVLFLSDFSVSSCDKIPVFFRVLVYFLVPTSRLKFFHGCHFTRFER
jgi:hypothetical protein